MSVASEITRLQNAKSDIKASIENKGVTVGDGTIDTYASKINEISTSSAVPQFTGNYDKIGLKTIGWSDEEINYYQKNGVQWNNTEDEYFKLTDTELIGDDSQNTRFLPKNTTKKKFGNYYKLLAIPMLDTSSVTHMDSMFYNCNSLTTIPLLNTSSVTNMNGMFKGCNSLTTIPLLNTSSVTNMSSMFNACSSLTTIPLLNTSSVTNMSSMFISCNSLTIIPLLNTSSVTNMNGMFNACSSLTTIPLLNTSSVTNMVNMFNGCNSLKTIPMLDTSGVTDMVNMFYACNSLTAIPMLDTSSVTDMSYMFYNCSSLTDFGGLENLGQAYLTTQPANYSSYKLDLSQCKELTKQSLINVLNNLYDIATKGCNVQQVTLGATNIAKLTAEEIAVATNKGWSVS